MLISYKKSQTNRFKKIVHLTKVNITSIYIIFSIFIAASFLDIIGISLIALFINFILSFDQFIVRGSTYFPGLIHYTQNELLIIVSISLFFFYTIKTIISLGINRIIINYCHNTQFLIALNMYDAMLMLRSKLKKGNSAASYVQNIQILTDSFSKQVLLPLFRLISDGLIVISLLIFLAFQNIFAFIFIILFTVSLGYLYDKSVRNTQSQQGIISNDARQKIIRNIDETYSGLMEIQIFCRELFFRDKFKHDLERFKKSSAIGLILATSPRYALELILMCFMLGVLTILNLTEVTTGEKVSVFSIYAFAAMRIVPLTNSMLSSISEIRLRGDTVDRLYSELQNFLVRGDIPSTLNKRNSRKLMDFKKLELKDVSFRYSEGEDILTNVNLDIQQGDLVAFIGESGSGKSTAIAIIMGLLKPSSGSVIVDGNVVESEEKLGDLCSFSPQVSFAIDGTVFENIALSKFDDALLPRAEESLVSSGFSNNPNVEMLYSNVETGGSNLSGGQLQRLALARALYFDKPILMLDEMTSSLDSKTEQLVFRNVKKLRGGKTVVVVTHNTKAIEGFDKVFVFENGTVTKR